LLVALGPRAGEQAEAFAGEEDLPGDGDSQGGGAAAKLRVTTMTAPDFHGKTLRQAMAEAASLGLALETRGAGVALRQSPPAGSPLPSGGTIRLELGRPLVGASSGE
jgi:hypothetical protein